MSIWTLVVRLFQLVSPCSITMSPDNSARLSSLGYLLDNEHADSDPSVGIGGQLVRAASLKPKQEGSVHWAVTPSQCYGFLVYHGSK